jgi:PAS domain S-box-containing protein
MIDEPVLDERVFDDAARLAALRRYDILDTPSEQGFDQIVRLAARELDAPIALISLLDERRQWFKARWGLTVSETPIEDAFCAHAIRQDGVTEVADAWSDPRFADNRLVTGAPHIRYYAGAPIVTPDGHALGTLCVIDTSPRPAISADQRATLQGLAQLVGEKLELRRQIKENALLLERAALRERLATLAVEAPDFNAAIRGAAEVLLEVTQARTCILWRMSADGEQVRFVHGTSDGAEDMVAFVEYMSDVQLTVHNSLAGRAMLLGEQQRVADVSRLDLSGMPANRRAAELGTVTMLYTPFSLQESRYVFVLSFASLRRDLDRLGELVLGAPTALRPMLRRLQDESQLNLFRRAVEASGDIVLITEAAPIDEPGPRIVYVNPGFERHTGYTAAEALGRTPRMLQGPDTDPAALANIRAALEAWRPVRQEVLNYHKDGTKLWVDLHIAPVANADGWFTHWISVQRDMTEARALAAEREAMSRDLAALIAAIPGVLMRQKLGADGTWMRHFVADTVEPLTGYTVAEAMSDGWWLAHIDCADVPKLRRHFATVRDGQQSTMVFRFLRKDGLWIWVRLSLNGHVDRFGEHEVIGIWSDVTHERDLAEQLAQASKLALLGEMATGMAHELNQPLAAISLAGENAQRSVGKMSDPPPSLQRRLTVIVEMAARASSLIDHTRVFGRTGTAPSEPVSVAAVLTQALSLIGSKLREGGVRVSAELPPDLPMVLAKPVPLEQVLINLLSNACDAYASTIWDRPGVEPLIRVRAGVMDGLVTIRVSDAAGGIAEDVIGSIFRPFFTTKPVGHGTGLGLSISYGIIAELGGTITATNEDGGAVFRVVLPVAAVG